MKPKKITKLQILECQGYTKEEAFKDLPFNPCSPLIKGHNITGAWKKAGKPVIGSVIFRRWIVLELMKRTKSTPGYGVYIVLSPPKEDTRTKPFAIINNKVEGIREWKFVYQIREDELKVRFEDDENAEIRLITPGPVVETCERKDEAIERMKKLISENRKSYSLIPVKIPNVTPIAAFGLYVPSVRAKKGTFIACGINKED